MNTARTRRVLRRTAQTVAAAASAAVLIGSGIATYALHHYDNNIDRVRVTALNAAPTATAPTASASPTAAADLSAQNFLIVGSDSRDLADSSQYGGAAVDGQRSDTVMLVLFPAGTAAPTIVSFPRDSWVRIPAHTNPDGDTIAAHMGKLNSALADGGPDLLVRLITNLSGHTINHYVQVDFDGFKNIVNSVGGLDVCIGTTRNDPDSGDYLTAGNHHIDGDQALAFVRDRKGLPGGDLDRIRDQQYFLATLGHQVESAGTLLNPLRLHSLLTSVTDSITVDDTLTATAQIGLAQRLAEHGTDGLTTVTPPVLDADGWRDGQSVVLLDDDALPDFFAALDNPAPATPAATAPDGTGTTPATVSPTAPATTAPAPPTGQPGTAENSCAP